MPGGVLGIDFFVPERARDTRTRTQKRRKPASFEVVRVTAGRGSAATTKEVARVGARWKG